MNKYLKLFGLLLLILFLVVYAADYIGYYDLIAHKKTVLTEEKMEEFEMEAEGLLARCILHENDHLDGVIYVDKVEGRLYNNEELQDEE